MYLYTTSSTISGTEAHGSKLCGYVGEKAATITTTTVTINYYFCDDNWFVRAPPAVGIGAFVSSARIRTIVSWPCMHVP